MLAQAGLPWIGKPHGPSKIDPYLPFIHETLAKFPTLSASRLLAMVQDRGYRGGESHFRHVIACHWPRPPPEAFLRLRSLPGEQAQVDWGHFGHLVIGRARRSLMAFVAVLSFSRQIFLRFFLDARMENFLRGHLGAFTMWNAVPRVTATPCCSPVLDSCSANSRHYAAPALLLIDEVGQLTLQQHASDKQHPHLLGSGRLGLHRPVPPHA